MRRYVLLKQNKIHRTINSPIQTQKKWLFDIIREGGNSLYGLKYGVGGVKNEKDYAKVMPLVDYEDIKQYIFSMMRGEVDILWPGKIKWFSKSSGTTNDASKYIPVTKKNLIANHIDGFTNAIGLLYQQFPDSDIFSGKSMTLGGKLEAYSENEETIIGDISAIILNNMPKIGKLFYALGEQIAFLEDWEEKIYRVAEALIKYPNITMIGGVPTWNIVLFNHMLELTGKSTMLEIWPKAKTYIHGGVGFEPYREIFINFFPREDFVFQEIYNASEGFFAAQDRKANKDLLLMLDHGIYYEFLPKSEFEKDQPKTVNLEYISLNTVYALVITTNSGLWRYMPGDTITFTSKYPFRIKLVGRKNQYINTFGEEVTIGNAENAIANTCCEFNTHIVDFTVAPLYFSKTEKGRHQWAIEFDQNPKDLIAFTELLDSNLQKLNSDYKAKRYKDLGLILPEIEVLPKGTFIKWMKHMGKFGAQNKVPRLMNSRKVMEEILNIPQVRVA